VPNAEMTHPTGGYLQLESIAPGAYNRRNNGDGTRTQTELRTRCVNRPDHCVQMELRILVHYASGRTTHSGGSLTLDRQTARRLAEELLNFANT